MGGRITFAGADLIARKQASRQPLVVSKFILANVPGLDVAGVVDGDGNIPTLDVVFYGSVTKSGYINPRQVVYSLMLGSDVGDFDFNWIGLETEEGVLLAVAYIPTQQKRKNIPPMQIGNNVTRNFMVEFNGAQALTGLTVDASTWQHDFTVRLHGIDERERLSNRDLFGRVCFLADSLKLEKQNSAYQLAAGVAYVEGIRVELDEATGVQLPELPATAWLDVALGRVGSDVVANWEVVFGAALVDVTDVNGVVHYRVPLADIPDYNTITDLRAVESISGALVQHFAARSGDYVNLRARATTKDDVGLGNLPNAKSDDEGSDSSLILATTKAVKAATTVIWNAMANIVSGATVVGRAAKLATARAVSLSGAVNGVGSFDGSGDLAIATTYSAASEGSSGAVRLAAVAESVLGQDGAKAVTPAGLHAARMRRVIRIASAQVQTAEGDIETTYAPLSHSFTADGGLYLVLVKLNTESNTGGAANIALTVTLKNNGTPLDVQASNMPPSDNNGHNFLLMWSGVLSGSVNLSVTVKAGWAGSPAVAVNADDHDMTSNHSGQVSSIEIYRMGA